MCPSLLTFGQQRPFRHLGDCLNSIVSLKTKKLKGHSVHSKGENRYIELYRIKEKGVANTLWAFAKCELAKDANTCSKNEDEVVAAGTAKPVASFLYFGMTLKYPNNISSKLALPPLPRG